MPVCLSTAYCGISSANRRTHQLLLRDKVPVFENYRWSQFKNLVDRACSVVRFERCRKDDCRTLHVLFKFCELFACQCYSSGELKSVWHVQVCLLK